MVFEGTISAIFLLCFALKFTTQAYLDHRNLSHILKNRPRVPSKFSGKVSLDDHQKAADYSRVRAQFGRFGLILDAILILYWTLGSGLEHLNNFTMKHTNNEITQALMLFGLFSLISLVISLPQSWYSQFSIEEKFGFNKSNQKLFFSDVFKQIILSVVIGTPLLAGFFWIMQKVGSLWWFYAWLFLSAFQFFIIWAYPTFIAPLFNKFEPLANQELKEKIEVFLKSVKFPFKGLFVMDASRRSSHGNAYFTGFGKNKRIVFFDTLINSLKDEEVIAVLAHEIGHFKKKHILKGLLKSLIFSLVGLYVLSLCLRWPLFFTEHGVQSPNIVVGFLLYMIISPIYLFCMTPINSYFSRKYEYEADTFAHENANSKMLINALVKMYKDNASSLTPDSLYSHFYHSHPPALERISHLESLK